jgi:DNA-binding NarL/FixJ family response regulator
MVAKVRLIICHQITLFRECLISALAEPADREIMVMDEPNMEAFPTARPDGRDLLLIDACLPDRATFRLLQTLRLTAPELRIILLASQISPDLIADCLGAGADGCVLDGDTFNDLREAIEDVLSDKKYLSPQMAHLLLGHSSKLVQSNPTGNGPPDWQLTPRQIEILQMCADRDLSNKQIARELHISVYTVKNHLHSIFEKMNVEDHRSAVRLALRQGLLREPSSSGKPDLDSHRSGVHPPARSGRVREPIA